MRTRQIALIVLIAVIAAFVWHLRSSRVAKFQRARREAAYRESAAAIETVIQPGMTRSDVEQILRIRSLPFNTRYGLGVVDDFVPLAHEASTTAFCEWDQVMVLIEFRPELPSGTQGHPNDIVKNVSLDHWAKDCL